MELLIGVLVTVGATGASIIASLWIARHYYFCSHPERTSVLALAMAARRAQRRPGQGSRHAQIDGAHDEALPLRWTLELIDAFEKGDIFLTELMLCAKTVSYVGDMLADPIRAASQAGVGYQTTSRRWSEAKDKALYEELAKVRADLLVRLSTI
jgi:hypothetical protein